MNKDYKTLFNENLRYKDEAFDLENEAKEVLKPVFKRYVDKEYNVREVSTVLKNVVEDLKLSKLLEIPTNEEGNNEQK